MKTALVTTTINVPTVLKLYRACSPDVHFFITGDRKTDDLAVMNALDGMGNYHYYGATAQERLGYKCSDLIGFNTIGRRSIAILEAIKWGADRIVTIDDDNLAVDRHYFEHFEKLLYVFGGYGKGFFNPPFYSGIQATGFGGWFDVGRLLQPKAPHRGFPHQVNPLWRAEPVVDAKVGVAAGICLGDPDISAMERIANTPEVHGMSELLRSGIAVNPKTWTVFNSQNTAFIRELAPCFLLPPKWHRYDDIWASLIAQRVMRERDLHVHFGQPFVWQQRNPHNLAKDLQAEMLGMEYTVEFAQALDRIDIAGHSVVDSVRTIYESIATLGWMPQGIAELGAAWCDDVEQVL